MSALGRIKRILLGPSTEDIDAQARVAGLPGYPIPHMDVRPPANLETGDPRYWSDVNDQAEADPVDYAPGDPDGTRAASEAITKILAGDTMPDTDNPRAAHEPDNEAVAYADEAVAEGRRAALEDDGVDVALTDSGVHALDDQAAAAPTVRSACTTCQGAGYVERTVNELLRESVALIPVDGGDMVIKEFYTRLLHAAPHLVPLFPRDLLTAATQDDVSPGALQRDRLLNAIVSLSDLYGSNAQDMTRLDQAIEGMGRAHAAFARPDGTVQGATPAEYMVVKDVFVGTLVDVAGDRWRPEYTAAWSEAYDYAMVGMLYAQYHSGMHAARYARRDAA